MGSLGLAAAVVPGNEAVQVVAEGAICAERLFVEKALDPASRADLVGMVLDADGPTHLPVPTAAENQQRSAGDASRKQAERNLPAGLLFFRHQNPGYYRAVGTACN